jgi:transposase
MLPLYLGVDIAQATFTAARWDQGRGILLGTFPNTSDGIAAFAATLPTGDAAPPIHLVLEPTAGYELRLTSFAVAQGWRVSMPNPKQVRDWIKGLGRRAKTDGQDALMLARYAADGQPPAWHPLPPEVSELDSLLRRKEDLDQLLRQERNRQHALTDRPGVAGAVPASIERLLRALEEELATVEQAIADHLQRHAALAAAAKRLQSVPGIGVKTVLPILVLLHRWHALTGGDGTAKGLAAYVGLDPQPYESGTSVHKRATISRLGDRLLRRKLFMGALGGVRGKNGLRAFYERLVSRGKKKKVALVAAARKLLTWAWAVFRGQTVFDSTKVAQYSAS